MKQIIIRGKRNVTAIFILGDGWKQSLKWVFGVKPISMGRNWVINKRNIQIWMVQNPIGMAMNNINKPSAHESLLPHLSPLQHARTGTGVIILMTSVNCLCLLASMSAWSLNCSSCALATAKKGHTFQKVVRFRTGSQ